jgi:cellulose synthase (UDP-forming)
MPAMFLIGLLPALLLAAGLWLLLPALPRDRLWARLVAVAILEVFALRYAWWRAHDTLPPFTWERWTLWQYGFFACEALALLYVCWSALICIRRTDRSAQADAAEALLAQRGQLPSVDVLIPTYGEGAEILDATLAGCLELDWPRERLRITVLDDGRRDWLAARCAELGVGYLRREERAHGKAGNLNHGLAHTAGELVLVLDADFIPQARILRRLAGLLDAPGVALVQTPQHYDNPDPIQHNLVGARAWTEEQRYFFDVAQPSRDAWGNAFCVGTGFLCRRSAFAAVGGYPLGCLCEDLYLSYALKSHGLRSVYLNEALSHGLATESLGEYIGQRVRWCQGTAQTLFLPYGPLRAPGLSWLDRVFYADVLLYWLSFPVLLLIVLSPVVYWFAGVPVFQCQPGDAFTMVLPRLVAVFAVTYWLSAGKVMPVVTELKKLITVFHVVPGLLAALWSPHGRAFRVTAKGVGSDRVVVQWGLMAPFLVLLVLTAVGMVLSFTADYARTPWNEFTAVNLLLSFYGTLMLGLCCLICIERPKGDGYWSRAQTQYGSLKRAAGAIARRVVG